MKLVNALNKTPRKLSLSYSQLIFCLILKLYLKDCIVNFLCCVIICCCIVLFVVVVFMYVCFCI